MGDGETSCDGRAALGSVYACLQLHTLSSDSSLPPFQGRDAEVRAANGEAELTIRAEVSDEVPQGAIWLPILHNQGTSQRLLRGGGTAKIAVSRS